LLGFGVQCVLTHGRAIVVGPPDVGGVGAANDLAAPGRVALIEHLQTVGLHEASGFSQVHDECLPSRA
jgi:hypothetical protein